MGIEEEAQALFKKWQTQQNAMMGTPQHQLGDPGLGTDQSPHLFNQYNPTSPDQSPHNPVNSVRPMGKPISKAPPMDPNLGMSNMGMSNVGNMPGQMADVCKECGMMHPPLAKGQRCPNARVAPLKTDDPNAVDDATVNKHVVDIRNIIMAQMKGKEIKNQKKFFQYAVIELTKALEQYNE